MSELDDMLVSRWKPGQEVVQIVLLESIQPLFQDWLIANGWELFAVPYSEDDLPTFAIRRRDLLG